MVPAMIGTGGKKSIPRWVPLLFDGLTAPMHSVNLLQGHFMDLEDPYVAWKSFQDDVYRVLPTGLYNACPRKSKTIKFYRLTITNF